MDTDLRLWLSADETRIPSDKTRPDDDAISGNGEWAEVVKDIDGIYLTFYVIRVEGDLYIAGTCWGSQLADVDYRTTHGKYAEPLSKVVADAWPIYTRLTARGKARDLSDGALINIGMEDGGVHRFLAISFLSPLINDAEDLYSGASGEAVNRLVELSRDLLVETHEGVESIPHVIRAYYDEPRPGVLSSTGFVLDRVVEVLGVLSRPGG